MNPDKPPTELQDKWLDAMTICWNPTKAAITAGYSRKGAKGQGSENMKKPHLLAELARRMKPRVEALGINQDRVLQELAIIAFGDLGDVCEWGPSGVTIKDSKKLTPMQRRMIGEVAEHFGSENRQGVKIKTHAKVKALETLANILQMIHKGEQAQVQAVQVNIYMEDGRPLEANIVKD
jgi:phage terminase small subunit